MARDLPGMFFVCAPQNDFFEPLYFNSVDRSKCYTIDVTNSAQIEYVETRKQFREMLSSAQEVCSYMK